MLEVAKRELGERFPDTWTKSKLDNITKADDIPPETWTALVFQQIKNKKDPPLFFIKKMDRFDSNALMKMKNKNLVNPQTWRKLVIELIKRKRCANEVLVQLARSSIIEDLTNLLDNKSSRVRELALIHLSKISNKSKLEQYTKSILEKTKDNNEKVRKAAWGLLKTMAPHYVGNGAYVNALSHALAGTLMDNYIYEFKDISNTLKTFTKRAFLRDSLRPFVHREIPPHLRNIKNGVTTVGKLIDELQSGDDDNLENFLNDSALYYAQQKKDEKDAEKMANTSPNRKNIEALKPGLQQEDKRRIAEQIWKRLHSKEKAVILAEKVLDEFTREEIIRTANFTQLHPPGRQNLLNNLHKIPPNQIIPHVMIQPMGQQKANKQRANINRKINEQNLTVQLLIDMLKQSDDDNTLAETLARRYLAYMNHHARQKSNSGNNSNNSNSNTVARLSRTRGKRARKALGDLVRKKPRLLTSLPPFSMEDPESGWQNRQRAVDRAGMVAGGGEFGGKSNRVQTLPITKITGSSALPKVAEPPRKGPQETQDNYRKRMLNFEARLRKSGKSRRTHNTVSLYHATQSENLPKIEPGQLIKFNGPSWWHSDPGFQWMGSARAGPPKRPKGIIKFNVPKSFFEKRKTKSIPEIPPNAIRSSKHHNTPYGTTFRLNPVELYVSSKRYLDEGIPELTTTTANRHPPPHTHTRP